MVEQISSFIIGVELAAVYLLSTTRGATLSCVHLSMDPLEEPQLFYLRHISPTLLTSPPVQHELLHHLLPTHHHSLPPGCGHLHPLLADLVLDLEAVEFLHVSLVCCYWGCQPPGKAAIGLLGFGEI